MDRYELNILTLAALDPQLAADVSRAAPGGHVRVFPSKSGAATAEIIRPDGTKTTLHSRFDPEDEAAGFVRAADTDKITTYIVLGFGLGYHIKALLAAARKESRIIVIEHDVGLFRAALEALDLREVFSSRRVFPIVGKSTPEIFAALNPHVVRMFLDATYLVHRPSVEAASEYYREVHQSLADYISYGMQNVITTVSVDLLSKMNTLMNLPYYAASPGIARLQGAYAGHPAIIVSAGPSLARNVDLLPQAEGRAVIIAVSTVFKPLLSRGIRPDFAVVLDYHPISRKYFDDAPGDDQVTLVADPKASWEAVNAHRGPKVIIHNDALHHIIGGPAFHKGMIPSGTTVAHSAFYFAEYIGADPIIFVGQDLAHPDGITHFPGTAVHDILATQTNRFESLEMREWETILRMKRTLRKITDVHGNDIYTDAQMFSYLQQFEMNFYNSKATIIDATEGGAAKRFTTAMTLAEALDRYAAGPLPDHAAAEPETPDAADEAGRCEIRRVLEERLSRTSQVRDFYDKTLSILHEIDDLWPDQQKIAPLLQQIEDIRDEVKSYTDVGSLVREIAQAIELNK
ncbi:MAG: motility associated factor glycosyltransferase family protein, partial [Planctomycetes bacterium]|nr:motility associated factor glycosyltransferase family protein [Planctomycetota bacterium]